jgi:hypothetical protein
MAKILVLASETIGGAPLLEAVRKRAESGDAEFYVVVPKTRPRHGNIVYPEAVRDAAQVRADLTQAFMREEGFEGKTMVGDEDPFTAAMDAIDEFRIDEVIVSTRPAASSGWLRRDLPERIQQSSGLPVEHIVVDIDSEGLPFDVTLVVANQTVAGGALASRLKEMAAEKPRRFIVVVPQSTYDGSSVRAAKDRLGQLLASLADDGIVAAGFIGDHDPYTAIMNAVQVFYISEIVISTLPENRSAWIEGGLIERAERATGRPVEHVVSQSEEPAEVNS